jgi:predicted MFS family arabinose efflux permease
LGYAFGAILSGVIADIFGINYAILTIGLLTVVSAIILQIRMPK